MRGALMVLAGLLCVWGCMATFGTSATLRYTVDGTRMFMSGDISTGSARRFIAMVKDNPQVDTIVLLDMPGSEDEQDVHDMGYFIRDAGLNTHLTPQSEIFSGAVDVFLAGNMRTMTCCAVIGVHDWADGFGEGSDYPPDAQEHDANVAYFQTMLGDDAFYWFTLQAAPSEGIHVMTPAEMTRFGVFTAPVLER